VRARRAGHARLRAGDDVVEDLPLEVGKEEAERGGCHDAEEGDAEERQLRQGELEAAPKVLRGSESAARLDALVPAQHALPCRAVLLVEAGGAGVPVAERAAVDLARLVAAEVALVVRHAWVEVERVRVELGHEEAHLRRQSVHEPLEQPRLDVDQQHRHAKEHALRREHVHVPLPLPAEGDALDSDVHLRRRRDAEDGRHEQALPHLRRLFERVRAEVLRLDRVGRLRSAVAAALG